MDISTLNTKAPAEKGAFLHLKHPATKALLWNGKGDDRTAIGVTVRGSESKAVRDFVKQMQKDALENPGQTKDDDLAYMVVLVMGFTGLERNGVPLDGDNDDDVRYFFNMSDGFVEQVSEFSRNRASFFKAAATA